jgi:hypothetical protein
MLHAGENLAPQAYVIQGEFQPEIDENDVDEARRSDILFLCQLKNPAIRVQST